MIHDISLAPPGPARAGLRRRVGDGRVEQQVVEPVVVPAAQPLQRLLGKGPDGALQVRQLERQDREAVPGAVEPERVVRRLRPADVARPEDEPVRLRLREELLDELEALAPRVSNGGLFVLRRVRRWYTRPDEAPVATMVLAMVVMVQFLCLAGCVDFDSEGVWAVWQWLYEAELLSS